MRVCPLPTPCVPFHCLGPVLAGRIGVLLGVPFFALFPVRSEQVWSGCISWDRCPRWSTTCCIPMFPASSRPFHGLDSTLYVLCQLFGGRGIPPLLPFGFLRIPFWPFLCTQRIVPFSTQLDPSQRNRHVPRCDLALVLARGGVRTVRMGSHDTRPSAVRPGDRLQRSRAAAAPCSQRSPLPRGIVSRPSTCPSHTKERKGPKSWETHHARDHDGPLPRVRNETNEGAEWEKNATDCAEQSTPWRGWKKDVEMPWRPWTCEGVDDPCVRGMHASSSRRCIES